MHILYADDWQQPQQTSRQQYADDEGEPCVLPVPGPLRRRPHMSCTCHVYALMTVRPSMQ
jgi:hypothetical protein